MALPCDACGGPLPSAGRAFMVMLAFGAGYAAVIWYLARMEQRGENAARAMWRADLLEAVRAGAVVVTELAERDGLRPPLPIDDVPTADLSPAKKGGE
jgi:hypothetical protein